MTLFENLEVKNYAKNYFSNLNPSKAPFYYIMVASSISIIATCSYLSGFQWYLYFVALTFLILYLIISASQSILKDKISEVYGEIRINRIIGIVVALIGMTLVSNSTKNSIDVFIFVLITGCIQICYYLLKKNKIISESKKNFKMINIPQMTLISNILLVTFFELSSDLALRERVFNYQKNKLEIISHYPKTYLSIVILSDELTVLKNKIESCEKEIKELEEKIVSPDNSLLQKKLFDGELYRCKKEKDKTVRQINNTVAEINKIDTIGLNDSTVKYLELSEKAGKIDTALNTSILDNFTLMSKVEVMMKDRDEKDEIVNKHFDTLLNEFNKYLIAALTIWFMWLLSFVILLRKTQLSEASLK